MLGLQFTAVEDIPKIVDEARNEFATFKTLPLAFRKQQLTQLAKLLAENEKEITKALFDDLRKNPIESALTEIVGVRNSIAESLDNLEAWAAPEKPSVDLVHSLDGVRIVKQPLGMVLIIGAWNYPFNLLLCPLIGAIAAGCAAVLKPSEVAPATANVISKYIPKYLDNKLYKVINGAVAETTKLLEEKFDHILYTGNGTVGRIVMAAAAKHLCPVTLELGGKSPAIIDDTCDFATVARRLVWGKFLNCGQTCIAPDYAIAIGNVQDKLVEQIKVVVKEFYGENPKTSDSYGRIINSNHFNRLKALLPSGTVVVGGDIDEADKFIAPTVLVDVSLTSPVMKSEIFGPILPIIKMANLDDAIKYINQNDKPLALYAFSNDKKVINRISMETTSGGFIANDCLMHFSVAQLPFGGVGASGMGSYHGKKSFDTFSHAKSSMFKDQNLEFANTIRYPPYTESKQKMVKSMVGKTVNMSEPGKPQKTSSAWFW